MMELLHGGRNVSDRGSGIRKALVTGGNGYVGSVLVRHLVQAGWNVHAVANRNHQILNGLLPHTNIHLLHGTPSDAVQLVTGLAPNAIFHLAAHYREPENIDDMLRMLENNLALGTSLLHGASICPVPPVFVNAGTYWQFSDPGDVAPNTFYAATKQAFHDILLHFRRAFAIRSTTLVLYDIIGPRDSRPKLWNKLIQATPGSSFPLSEGKQPLELVHVDDIARAFLHAASLLYHNQLPGPLYTLRSAERQTLREFLESLKDAKILDLQFKWGEIPYWYGQIFDFWGGEQLPGWSPQIDIRETMAEMAHAHALGNSLSTCQT
jgi:nucleoside-diphosphate-sugar epimerase